jgi:heme oxygenase
MLVRLALDTQHHHGEADADRLALMEIRTRDEYRDAIARIYGLEATVETAIAAELDGRYFTPTKLARLRCDLLALDMSEQEIAVLPRSSARIRSAAQAFGWLFVLERQTLLSGLLRRHLEHMRQPWFENASAYLAAGAETPGARFRAFGAALSEQAKCSGGEPIAIASAASEAFRCQRQWYLTSPSHKRLRKLFDDPMRPKVWSHEPATAATGSLADELPEQQDHQ